LCFFILIFEIGPFVDIEERAEAVIRNELLVTSKLFLIPCHTSQKKPIHPAAIETAVMVTKVVTEITKAATDKAPTKIATRHVKKIAIKPPTAAKDISRPTIMVFVVAAKKKSIKAPKPVVANSKSTNRYD